MTKSKRGREVVYICGKMSGLPLLGFPSFDRAARRFRKAGFNVVNPADIDRVNHTHEFTPPSERCTYREAMKRDLAAICECDSIALLSNWRKSPGANLELHLAKLLGLKIYDAKTMKVLKPEEL